jgi:energy-coupling factor transporter ATP-binding protein EcfA2
MTTLLLSPTRPRLLVVCCATGIDGLSTEARKRLTIAVELVALPLVLFLDEPTSGLDTRAAVIIANVMRDICRRGVTVVATIHQPSAAIFSMFDDLMLLKRGGFLVYAGPLGPNCSTLINYFSAVPGTPPLREVSGSGFHLLAVIIDPQQARSKKQEAAAAPLPDVQGINPSAWMLEVVGGAAALSDEDYPDLVKVYADSSLAKAAAAEIRTLCKEDHADYYCKEEQPAKQDDDDDGGGGVNDGDNDKGVKRSPTTTTTAVQSSVVPLPAVADDDHVKPPAPNTAPTRPQPAEQHLNPVAPAGALRQLYMLIWRARISYWRNPAANFNRFVITLLIALIIGSIEWGKGE